MAELIVKEVLDNEHIYVIEIDGSIHKMIFCGDCDWEERPVTTLAEIRAKAIDEFAEKLDAHCEKMMKDEWNNLVQPTSWASAYAEFKEDVEEIAEQLKGGMRNDRV